LCWVSKGVKSCKEIALADKSICVSDAVSWKHYPETPQNFHMIFTIQEPAFKLVAAMYCAVLINIFAEPGLGGWGADVL
jgi:hypothetical protein